MGALLARLGARGLNWVRVNHGPDSVKLPLEAVAGALRLAVRVTTLQPADRLFLEIQELIIYSLLSVQKVIIQDKHSFELYGYDVMIDSHLKPWLIEVNARPSLSADTDAGYALKYARCEDTLDVVDSEDSVLYWLRYMQEHRYLPP